MSSFKTLIRKKLVLIFEERNIFFFHQRPTYTLYDFKFPSIMVELYVLSPFVSASFFIYFCALLLASCMFFIC